MYNGKIGRYDCLIIEGGIVEPESEEPPKTETIQEETPVSTYEVDDSEAIKSILGGDK